MLRWLALAAVISVAFSEEATVISKGLDAADTVESAPQVAAESQYPLYGRRTEERDRHYDYRQRDIEYKLKDLLEHQNPHDQRHQGPKDFELYESHEPRQHEVKGHFEHRELHTPHDLKGHLELHELHKSHELRKSHEPKGHHEPRHHELKGHHEPRHHELKGRHGHHEFHDLRKPQEPRHHDVEGHHKLQTDKLFEPAGHHRGHKEHEHYGHSVAKTFDPHRMAYHTPHGVGIIKDVLSPDYVQPTWFLDYRYVKTGHRDYAIGDGGQVMILPDHVKNHEPKEYDNFAELLEVSRLKKLAEKSAQHLRPEKEHGLGYMRGNEERMEQIRGRMVHEHDRHREHLRGHYEH